MNRALAFRRLRLRMPVPGAMVVATDRRFEPNQGAPHGVPCNSLLPVYAGRFLPEQTGLQSIKPGSNTQAPAVSDKAWPTHTGLTLRIRRPICRVQKPFVETLSPTEAGLKRGRPTLGPRVLLFNWLPARCQEASDRNLHSNRQIRREAARLQFCEPDDTVDGSTFTPGPMVEEIATRWM